MSLRRPLCLWALLLPLAFLGSGCQREPPYGVVEGVVTLDGKALANVEVVFLPDPEKGTRGRRSVALTDEHGRYRLASDAGRPGAPVGIHRVCVNDLLAGPPGAFPLALPEDNPKGRAGTKADGAGLRPTTRSRFPPAYSDANVTPFRNIEVKEGSQEINLTLKSEGPRCFGR